MMDIAADPDSARKGPVEAKFLLKLPKTFVRI